MKKLVLLSLFLASTVAFAGEKSNVKIKFQNVRVKLFNIPEIFSEIKHKNISINFIDEKGKTYNTNTIADPNYIYKFLTRPYMYDSAHYKINVERLSSERTNNSKINTKKINQKGSEVVVYFQERKYIQKYKITVTDVLDENKIIYEQNITIEAHSEFPYDDNGLYCYSESCVKNSIIKYNLTHKGEDAEKLAPKLEQKATERVLMTNIKNHLNSLLTYRRGGYNALTISVKSKTTDFELLDSASIYLLNGLKVLKNQIREKNIINYHSKAAFDEFNNAYRIYKQYNSDKYFNIITGNETKNEFKNYMRYMNYLTAYLTSRYDEALSLYDLVKRDVDKKHEKDNEIFQAAKDDPNNISKQLNTIQLKYSIEERVFFKMKILYKKIIRDKRLYSIQKDFYNFYK